MLYCDITLSHRELVRQIWAHLQVVKQGDDKQEASNLDRLISAELQEDFRDVAQFMRPFIPYREHKHIALLGMAESCGNVPFHPFRWNVFFDASDTTVGCQQTATPAAQLA
jgi:hypothetical protein